MAPMAPMAFVPRPALPRAAGVLASAVLVALLQLSAFPLSAAAQIRPDQVGQDVHRPTVTPRFGPPGTKVTFTARELPPLSFMFVGVGVVGGGGHQMVGRGGSDADGNLEMEVTLPDWAEPGTSHYFFVATADQRPRAMAPVFLVSDADGVVRVSGDVEGVDGPCGMILKQGGDRLGLLGDFGALRPGNVATVEGRVVDAPGCDDALVIRLGRVVSVR